MAAASALAGPSGLSSIPYPVPSSQVPWISRHVSVLVMWRIRDGQLSSLMEDHDMYAGSRTVVQMLRADRRWCVVADGPSKVMEKACVVSGGVGVGVVWCGVVWCCCEGSETALFSSTEGKAQLRKTN